MSRSKCWILFGKDGPDLDAVRSHLSFIGMMVADRDGGLAVRYADEPHLFVHLVAGKKAETLREDLLESVPEEVGLAECSQGLVITFENFRESLREMNTLIEVQAELQELTSGYMYRSWNNTLAAPDGRDVEL